MSQAQDDVMQLVAAAHFLRDQQKAEAQYYSRVIAEIAQRLLAAPTSELAAVQKALSFWLPKVPETEGPIATRIANDAWLLAGMAHEDVVDQDAEAMGWITVNASQLAAPAAPVPTPPTMCKTHFPLHAFECPACLAWSGQPAPGERQPLPSYGETFYPDCDKARECVDGCRYGKGCFEDELQSAMGGKPWQECHCGINAQGKPVNA